MGDDTERVLLGEIGAAHGLKGEVRLRSYTETPIDIAAYGPLEDETGTKQIEIERVRVTPKALIAYIRGVTTREAAETLNGIKLYVPRARLPEQAPNEWYVADLIGLEALGTDGKMLGTVVAVHNFGASDILEVTPSSGGSDLLVAFTEQTVPKVDIEKGQLVLAPPKEFEDETEHNREG